MVKPLQSKLLKRKQAHGHHQLGDVLSHNLDRLFKLVTNVAHQEYKKGITGNYYIHVWFAPSHENKDRVVPWCQSRKTRPSPYQMYDHYLWRVESTDKIEFQWCIPKKEIVSYILAHPSEFDLSYVAMLKKFCSDKLEHLSDYMEKGKIV